MRRWRWPLIVGGPLLVLGTVAYFVLTSGRVQATDNAYVQIAKAPVSASIGGRVTEIYVHENQRVTKGQVLFRLDPRDYQASAEAAAAQVADASLRLSALRAAYRQQQASVQAARETVAYAAREAARERQLADAGVASQAQLDEALTPPSRPAPSCRWPSSRPPRRWPVWAAIQTCVPAARRP